MSLHLDRKRLRALLDGSLKEETEKQLVGHLAEGGCDQCEEFLGTLEEAEETELFAIIERGLQAKDLPEAARHKVLETRPGGLFGLPPLLVPVAGLAILVLVALVTTLSFVHKQDPDRTGVEEGTRIKGPAHARAPAVELTLGLVTGTDEEGQIVRLADGSEAPQDAKVVMRVKTDGSCYLYLLRVDAAGKLEVLLPDGESNSPFFHPGGKHTPMISGYPAGAALAKLAGVQHFVAGCALKPLKLPGDLKPLLDFLRTGKGLKVPGNMVSFDVVTVKVTGEGDPR